MHDCSRTEQLKSQKKKKEQYVTLFVFALPEIRENKFDTVAYWRRNGPKSRTAATKIGNYNNKNSMFAPLVALNPRTSGTCVLPQFFPTIFLYFICFVLIRRFHAHQMGEWKAEERISFESIRHSTFTFSFDSIKYSFCLCAMCVQGASLPYTPCVWIF